MKKLFLTIFLKVGFKRKDADVFMSEHAKA